MINKILSRLHIARLKWHDLRSVHPVSRTFGFDRGTPIDRYYIEEFLAANKIYITGRLLEIAGDDYSRKFGHEVEKYDVLHVSQSRAATIVGDLTEHESLPRDLFDCFICTQVLNFVFDFQKAIEGGYSMLKTGGVMLTTVGGISSISRYDADRWGHFWSFYPQGIDRAFKNVFGDGNVSLRIYGNSLTAIGFIKGLALDELSKDELDFLDEDYPVCIGIIAKKD